MQTHRIMREQWAESLASFSREHEHWLSTVDVFGPRTVAYIQAREEPLGPLALERDADGRESIAIHVGKQPREPIRVVEAPVAIVLKETDEGAHAALEIEARDGGTTRISFRSAMPTDAVDGVLLQH